MSLESALLRAAAVLREADGLLIAAGAGMGVDSGLPDFRGPQGFWKAYPVYAHLKLDFVSLANPRWFRRDPALAWGFYGHRRNLYRRTSPHRGFALLRQWARNFPAGAFIFTSNVDNHFQVAGFAEEQICEVHGSLEWNQCLDDCGIGIFPAEATPVTVDESTFRAKPPWPACPRCGGLARPNVLMFGDSEWLPDRTASQDLRLQHWLASVERVAVIECGAGTAVPTVRRFCEAVANYKPRATLIRINPNEPQVPAGQIALALPARTALEELDRRRAAL
jgi:NAD-dependent SIR2 family protein deacetylase